MSSAGILRPCGADAIARFFDLDSQNIKSNSKIQNKSGGHEAPPYTLKLTSWPDHKQFLPILDWLAVRDQFLHDLTGHIRLNFIHQLHGFHDAQNLPDFDHVPDFDKRWRSRRRALIECPDNRRMHRVQSC